MEKGISALSHAVRPWAVARYLGQLVVMLALLTLVPLVVAVALGEGAWAWRYLLVIALLTGAGLGTARLQEPEQLQVNEAVVVVSLAFLLAPLVMAYPMMASGLDFEDALFEAVSAVTTTGLSTAGSASERSAMLLFARSWMQWYGGLGIAALSVALLMGHHAAARRLVVATEPEDIATTARTHARQVLVVYVVLTVAGAALLWALVGDGFVTVVHVFSTVSTGGFSTFDDSLADMPRAGAWLVTGLSLASAVPLLLYFHAARRNLRTLVRDPEVRALVVVCIGVGAMLVLTLHAFSGYRWGAALEHGVMLGVSAQSTTGFSTLSVVDLDPLSKLLLIGAMVIGGSTGSTAGGLKLLRLLVVLRLLQFFLRRTAMPPHAAVEPRLAGRRLERPDVERVLLTVVSIGAVLGCAWMAFLAYGYQPLDALLEVASALGTVGLSTDIARPSLETPLKYLLCAVMLLGRLEILALMVLVYPPTWLGRRA
jgi:trk system potassium uptake protein